MPSINCEVSWSENCVLKSNTTRNAAPGVDAIYNPTGETFKINNTKLYVTVVTLSAENDNKLFEQLKTGFKRAITWNKYRSEISNQAITNNLNYLIDPTFTNVNRLLVLSYEKETDRTSFSKYYVPNVEIKYFNVLTDGKHLFEIPVKNKEEAYEAIIEISENSDYRTSNLLTMNIFQNTTD